MPTNNSPIVVTHTNEAEDLEYLEMSVDTSLASGGGISCCCCIATTCCCC